MDNRIAFSAFHGIICNSRFIFGSGELPVIVIYSTILSTFNLTRDINCNRYRTKVTCGLQIRLPGPSNPCFYVQLNNIGDKPIGASEAGIYINEIIRRMGFFNPSTISPSTIQSGDSYRTNIQITEIKNMLITYRIAEKVVENKLYFRETIVNVYKRKYIKLERDIHGRVYFLCKLGDVDFVQQGHLMI